MKSMVFVSSFLAMLAGASFAALDSTQKSDILAAHNSARAAVGVGALVWDDVVATFAENWAANLRDTQNCNMVHSRGPYGENLWKWWGSNGLPAPNPVNAVTAWVNEQIDYNYATNTCAAGKVCGHYTQVVWKNSNKLGCAFVKCNGMNSYIVSCNYDPRGNYVGQKPY